MTRLSTLFKLAAVHNGAFAERGAGYAFLFTSLTLEKTMPSARSWV